MQIVHGLARVPLMPLARAMTPSSSASPPGPHSRPCAEPPWLWDRLQLVDVSDDNLVEGRVAPNRFGCHAQGTGSCLLPSPLNRVR
jgi:hypothetical protein